jgi:hypothetical protein
MHGVRHITCLLAAVMAAALGGCGAGGAGKGYGDSVDKARAAKALSSLQVGLVSIGLLQADSAGSSGQDVATALQAKDPTNRYTTAVPAETGVVQVLGSAAGPVMLVALSTPASEDRPAQYVGAWQGTGTTMYYAGTTPPAYTTQPPATAGWASTPPQ